MACKIHALLVDITLLCRCIVELDHPQRCTCAGVAAASVQELGGWVPGVCLAGRFQCAAAAVIARELQVALALPDATASAMQQAGLIILPLGPGLVCLLVFLRGCLACVWVPLLVLWVAGMC